MMEYMIKMDLIVIIHLEVGILVHFACGIEGVIFHKKDI